MRAAVIAVCLLVVVITVSGVIMEQRSSVVRNLDKIIEVPPGAKPYSIELKASLAGALAAKGRDYQPRTHHLRPDGSPKYTNRLILESSPYLLQHAHNPVDWYPWGDEAFARAREEGKPVLLSIGYSTCHWCHVMERESFEDEEIAAYLNENYICIKVDREVRPDLDGIYMAAVRMVSGSGGWPMTVWLTPDRRPFYGGTYFPARDGDRGVRIGFLTIVKTLRDLYDRENGKVERTADEIVERIQKALAPEPASADAGSGALDEAFTYFQSTFDSEYGGFGSAPKFPRSVSLEFLLRYHRSRGNDAALDMVVKTLEAMAAGGVYDQVGGGFHRYSTDARWLVPHFEKMLYDNAQLAVAYLEAYQATGRTEFADVARDILRYVGREMTAPGGAFYSATDADSEGGEGIYFVWTPEEIELVVGPQLAEVVTTVYGVTDSGNFEGRNILYRPYGWAEAASMLGRDAASLRAAVSEARELLYQARQQRVPPATDTKILTAWNGLMIAAFARAGMVLGNDALTARGVRAARFILDNLMRDDHLMRSYKDGVASQSGYLEDYAFMIAGLVELYESSSDPFWLRQALRLQKTLDGGFWDSEHGGYFMTAVGQSDLLAREKPDYDGAEPSGNSVAILNLLRLNELTGDDSFRKRADQTLKAFSLVLGRAPAAVPKMLAALDFRLGSPKEVVIVKPSPDASAEALLRKVRTTFVPNKVVSVVAEGEIGEQDDLVPLLEGKRALGGKTTGYVCKGRVCDLPTSDPLVFAKQLVK